MYIAHKHPYPQQTSLYLSLVIKEPVAAPSCKGHKGPQERGCLYSGRQQEKWGLGITVSHTTKCLLRTFTASSKDEKNQGPER